MATLSRFSVFVKAILIFALLAVLVLEDVDARGRGGGSRGGSRSSRSSSSSRSYRSGGSTSRATKTRITNRFGTIGVRRYRGPVYKSSYWKTGMAVGLVYGLTSYKRRRMYYSHPRREPTICFNEKNLKNGTYGYFICPERDQPDSWNYCCGETGGQKCCKYFDQKEEKSSVAGIVVGVIAAVVVIGVVVYCCVKKRRSRQGVVIEKNKGADLAAPVPEAQPLQTDYSGAPPVQMTTYNVQPTPLAQNDYGVPPQPMGYNAAAPAPYDPNPGGLAGYAPPPQGPAPIGFEGGEKPPLPTGDTSAGLPYPDNPQAPAYPPGAPGAYPPPNGTPQGMPPPYQPNYN